MDIKEARRLVAQENGRKNLAKRGKKFYKEISALGVAARKKNKLAKSSN